MVFQEILHFNKGIFKEDFVFRQVNKVVKYIKCYSKKLMCTNKIEVKNRLLLFPLENPCWYSYSCLAWVTEEIKVAKKRLLHLSRKIKTLRKSTKGSQNLQTQNIKALQILSMLRMYYLIYPRKNNSLIVVLHVLVKYHSVPCHVF